MPIAFLLSLVAALLTQHPATAALKAQGRGAPGESVLDFEYYRTKVEPIFLARRDGNTRCVSCHSKGTPMRLQELSPGATTWNEEQSRKNFGVIQLRVVPRSLTLSRLLVHPLASEGGALSTTVGASTGPRFSMRSGRRSPIGCAGGDTTRRW